MERPGEFVVQRANRRRRPCRRGELDGQLRLDPEKSDRGRRHDEGGGQRGVVVRVDDRPLPFERPTKRGCGLFDRVEWPEPVDEIDHVVAAQRTGRHEQVRRWWRAVDVARPEPDVGAEFCHPRADHRRAERSTLGDRTAITLDDDGDPRPVPRPLGGAATGILFALSTDQTTCEPVVASTWSSSPVVTIRDSDVRIVPGLIENRSASATSERAGSCGGCEPSSADRITDRASSGPIPNAATSAVLSTPVRSVVGIVVVVEGDAVLLGQGGVLVVIVVIIRTRRGRCRPVTKAEIKRSRAGLLQFSRLFEPAMTTLLHDRAPTL